MGLGLPLALLGLLGIAIPLWLHRVRRKTLRAVPLPTVALLERAVVQKRRSLSFVDRPLLYARMLLAALAALALTRPYLSQLASYASEHPLALAVVLDDSMSMQRKALQGGSLFEAARQRAARVLAELAPDSEGVVVLGGNTARVFAGRTSDLAALRERLAALELVGARGTALGDALTLALRELAGSRHAVKEVLVLTDCAAHAAADRLDSDAMHVRVECIGARGSAPNHAITDMKLTLGRDVSEPNTLYVSVSSDQQEAEIPLRVEADGQRLATQNITLAQGVGRLELAVSPAALRGVRTLSARIERANALGEDDVRELSLASHGTLSVLLVDGDPAPTQLDDELRFAALALSLSDDEHAAPQLTRIDADGLDGVDWPRYDVAVFANVRAPSADSADAIERYVASGGGLLITAGDHVDAFAYRGTMAKLLPAVVRSDAPADPPLAIALEGVSSGLVPAQGRGLETASTRQRLLLEPTIPPAETVLKFTDGSALLAAKPYGSGTVALLTTTLDDDWTDLPLTPGFLPLLNGLVRGLAAFDALPPGPYPAGSTLTVRAPQGASGFYLVTPDSRRVDLNVRAGQITIDETAVPGAYHCFATLEDQHEQELEQLSFLITADTRDSNLALRAPKTGAAQKRIASASHARSIDGWFWLFFGVCAIAEGVLRLRAKPHAQPEAAA